MNKKIGLEGWAAALALLWGAGLAHAANEGNRAAEAASPSPPQSQPVARHAVSFPRESAPRIMVVVPETLMGRPRVPDPAGETELIHRLVEANFQVLDASEVALFRYSQEMGHIIKESDTKAMKALCRRYHCDLFIAGDAFSEQVNEQPAHEVVPISARARIEVKAFIVESGEIIAADAAVSGATDQTPAVAGKTALQNAATDLAGRLIPRLQTAIEEGRVVRAVPPPPPYLLYGVAAGMTLLVLTALILVILFQQRRASEETAPPVDPRLSGQATLKGESP